MQVIISAFDQGITISTINEASRYFIRYAGSSVWGVELLTMTQEWYATTMCLSFDLTQS